ncbi:P-loop containing nucleoside triphosphate hydrolase protein [Mycena floridula]|nr:P-loop containing nucleoside triphosphate hydrolase protein [Mycena floridula]
MVMQLEIFLAGFAVVSFLIIVASQLQRTPEIALSGDSHHFDVMSIPEDHVDGYPVDKDAFWKKMYWRKLTLSALLFSIVLTRALSLSFIQTAFASYTLIVCMYSLLDLDGTVWHAVSVAHLAFLTTFAAFLFGMQAIIPSSTTDYASFSLYSICASITLTMPRGPDLYFPPDKIYTAADSVETSVRCNTSGIHVASILDTLLCSFTTKVVLLGIRTDALNVSDLPILTADLRASVNFVKMRQSLLRIASWNWKPKMGSGVYLTLSLIALNGVTIVGVIIWTITLALLYYAPAFYIRLFLEYVENDEKRLDRAWGSVYVASLFLATFLLAIANGQLWSLATNTLQVRISSQLNTILFAKTLTRKDLGASSEGSDLEFYGKSQVMTLMTTDVDRVRHLATYIYRFIDMPTQVLFGMWFLYQMIGISSFYGLATVFMFLPFNHFSFKIVIMAQEKLMKARDRRVGLTNEMLNAIRMLKRNFESRIIKVREDELKYQSLSFTMETLWTAVGNASPILFAVVSFWHFTVVLQQDLTPSIAFTSLTVFAELQSAISQFPETILDGIQSFISIRRIEKYLDSSEVEQVPSSIQGNLDIELHSATVSWPTRRSSPSASTTPHSKFMLTDLNLQFPREELSLICGKLGSGKSLLLLALLGDADVLAGQIQCPRSPPDALPSFIEDEISSEQWIVSGNCAYVPQTAWLRNQSIKDNILFNLPFDEVRYQKTLDACALIPDLLVLEEGDDSQIGERGVNLSGGQKARVSLARAVYSRASILLLDDVLSGVDAHTARHLYYRCLKGELMLGRTVLLVSHHVQLCLPGATYVVALDTGRVAFSGTPDAFKGSKVMRSLVAQTSPEPGNQEEAPTPGEVPELNPSKSWETRKPKPILEEKRSIGRIERDVWRTYLTALGSIWYWLGFSLLMGLAGLAPVVENGWLRIWSGSYQSPVKGAMYYVSIYAAVSLILKTMRWFMIFSGTIQASKVLFKRLLETILFSNLRFHDTVSRGRILNRFGNDFAAIDSGLPNDFGHTLVNAVACSITFPTLFYVGGTPFVIAALVMGLFYIQVTKLYGHTSRDLRRLTSVTNSPLFTIYGDTIAGVVVIRAFGASNKFMRDMICRADTNRSPYYWQWCLNRWLSVRSNILTGTLVGTTAMIVLLTPKIDSALAEFALTFANSVANDVRRYVSVEQHMVSVERVKEYSDLPREPAEYIEPRPDPSWPDKGGVKCDGLVIRYAPDLPDVLHGISFEIPPGEKVGVIGRTGSGKSTLALSFFRFVEATQGSIQIDGLDISTIGLTDLRRRLTIIPQDPTILSGTLRSTLDVFGEYSDLEIYDALRRVHLISAGAEQLEPGVFSNLDTVLSESGDNFSTGERQLLCMARAVLKHSKILIMDESHMFCHSVDYATDELISQTIHQEFVSSTVITIAHRIRTIIQCDRVMILDQGRIVEFDSPRTLFDDSTSSFSLLCQATGQEEMNVLRKMANARREDA